METSFSTEEATSPRGIPSLGAQDQTQRSCNMIETLCCTKGVLPSGIPEPLVLKIRLLILLCRTMGTWCYIMVLARTSGRAFTIEDVRDKHLYAFQKAKHYIGNKRILFIYFILFVHQQLITYKKHDLQLKIS